ncbi:CLUMA_CG014586, isoform A [Clunio marinus]|uniref:CLUMA_CG014586, isoform A n=1 Tax=Clunio marinus TaxID=568069 RepID=A0A1J1ILR0_9DIPT|nr:CLUMA_CG014586, isoform A [Clunio marinus]
MFNDSQLSTNTTFVQSDVELYYLFTAYIKFRGMFSDKKNSQLFMWYNHLKLKAFKEMERGMSEKEEEKSLMDQTCWICTAAGMKIEF